MARIRRSLATVVAVLAGAAGLGLSTTAPAGAAIFPADQGTVYKEYWVPHTTWTGGCAEHGLYKPSDAWFIEPGPCTKTITFEIPDDVSRVARVEIYLDLWRNYEGVNAARFQINGGPVRQPPVGLHWSRTPWRGDIPVGELRQGTNTITFLPSPKNHRYHVHDVAFRVYHTPSQPLVAGPGSDVTPPSVNLTGITHGGGTAVPGNGGALDVNADTLVFSADATDAKVVEFHAFYDGYDTDNDGQTLDWHGFSRNNWNPGGVTGKRPPATGSTVGIPGADITAPYAVSWNLAHVANQAGVKFKARAVDAAGNVRETPASAPFELQRTATTSVHRIAGFKDFSLHTGGMMPKQASVTIDLPDLTGVESAYLVGHYWQNPFVRLNAGTEFTAFTSTEDVWTTSVRQIPLADLKAGANTITYRYNPDQISYGQFVEKPGPMIVLRRSGEQVPEALAIVTPPADATVAEGQSATFSVVTKGGTGPVSYRWSLNGTPMTESAAATFTVGPVTAEHDGARVEVTAVSGTETVSATASIVVSSTPPPPPPPGLSATVSGQRVTEGHGADGGVLVFKITLSAPATGPVTVVLATDTSGSATVGADFFARSATEVVIPAGARAGWFGVKVRGDRLRESNETVGVTVVSASGVTISGGALGTITDDD